MYKVLRNAKSELKDKKIFYSVFTLFIIFNIFLIFKTRLFPFIDLPQHLALSTIKKYIGGPNTHFDKYFQMDHFFLRWNTFHAFFTSLDLWPSIEFGNRIFLSAYIILLPSSVLYTIKKLKGHIWLSILSFLLIYNFNVIWGFVPFFSAVPICIFTFGANTEYLKTKSTKHKFLIPILLILTYHMHILPLLFLTVGLFIQNFIYNRKNIINFLKTCLPYITGILLLIFFAVSYTNDLNSISTIQSSINSTASNKLGFNFFDAIKLFPYRLKEIGFKNFSYLYKNGTGRIIGLLFTGILFSPLVILITNFNRKNNKNLQNQQLSLIAIPYYYFIIYLFYPGVSLYWQRYSVYIFLLLIIIFSSFIKKSNHIFKIIITSASIVYFLLIGDYFNEYNEINKNFDKSLFKGIKKEQILSGLIIQNIYRGKPYMFNFFPDYHIIWNKGIESLRLADGYPDYPMRRKVSKKVLPNYCEHIFKRRTYDGRFNNVDYLLLRGNVDDLANQKSKKQILNNFELFRERGVWHLYKNEKLYNKISK